MRYSHSCMGKERMDMSVVKGEESQVLGKIEWWKELEEDGYTIWMMRY